MEKQILNKNQDEYSLAKIPVSKAVIKNVIPAMFAMLMTLVYNLADTFFIGQTHDALQVAAVSLATPVFLIFMSIGNIFGIGGTSVISRALGAGKTDFAKKSCSFCFWNCIFTGIFVSAFFLVFMNWILKISGASAETWEFAKNYLVIVTFSGPFVLISSAYSNILRAEGESTRAMTGQILGNFLNIILDPIMILGFGWNIKGAAIATVIGNIAGAAYYIIYFLRGKSKFLSISPKEFSAGNGICSGILSIGIPAALGSFLMSISQIIMNSLMSSYGDMALAGIGVAMKVTMMTGMIAMGIGQGVQPLLGWCVGAKDKIRYKKIFRFSLIFAFTVSVVLTAICYVFVSRIAASFVNEQSALDFAVRFSKKLLTTSSIFGIYFVFVNALQASGATVSSFILNISRQGIIYIPLLFVFSHFLGANGLIWTQPAADILSLFLAVVLYYFS